MRRVDNALTIKLDSSLDCAISGHRCISAAARAWNTAAQTATAQETAEAGLLDGCDTARELRRVWLFNLHLPVSRRGFRSFAHAVVRVADFSEHEISVELVVGHAEARLKRALLADGLKESVMRVPVVFDGDCVLSLTNVEIAERIVGGGHAFRVIRSLEKIERVLQARQSLIRMPALQKNSTLLQRIGSLSVLLWNLCRFVRCRIRRARYSQERIAGDDC